MVLLEVVQWIALRKNFKVPSLPPAWTSCARLLGGGLLLVKESAVTETEWLKSANPPEIVAALKGKVSDRKLRLFGYACCCRVIQFITDKQLRATLEMINLYADGFVNSADLVIAENAARGSAAEVIPEDKDFDLCAATCILESSADAAEYAARRLLIWEDPFAPGGAASVAYHTLLARHKANTSMVDAYRKEQAIQPHSAASVRVGRLAVNASRKERAMQCRLLIDICGPLPFRPITIDPAWLSAHIESLARRMYQRGDFSTMPNLADALQDAGCDNADILDHCRGPGPHVRGCWVVDKLLAKW